MCGAPCPYDQQHLCSHRTMEKQNPTVSRYKNSTQAVQCQAFTNFAKLRLPPLRRYFQLTVPTPSYARFHWAYSVSRQLIIPWSQVRVLQGPPNRKPRTARLFVGCGSLGNREQTTACGGLPQIPPRPRWPHPSRHQSNTPSISSRVGILAGTTENSQSRAPSTRA